MRGFNLIFKSVVMAFCLFWITKEVLVPCVAYYSYKEVFMQKANACGNAMDSNWYIEQADDDGLKKTSQVQMLDCHYYDKTRKLLLMFGVPEEAVSYLGLLALELEQQPASKLTEQHQFRQR